MDALLSVHPCVGIPVLMPQMQIIMYVTLVITVVDILQPVIIIQAHSVHGAAQNVKTIAHLIAVSHALKLSKVF